MYTNTVQDDRRFLSHSLSSVVMYDPDCPVIQLSNIITEYSISFRLTSPSHGILTAAILKLDTNNLLLNKDTAQELVEAMKLV